MRKLTELTIDFETYYSKKEKYALSAKGMSYEKYIRDPRFEVIGLAWKKADRKTEFLAPHEIEDWINHIEVAYGWENVRLIAQNAVFDASILGLVYGIYPAQVADTMGMSKAIQQWDGNSLDIITRNLRSKYGWVCTQSDVGAWCGIAEHDEEFDQAVDKGTEVYDADGKHLMDFTDEEYNQYAEYCCTDVDLTWSAYRFFLDFYKFPEEEIDVMTTAIEMYTYPVMELDKAVLEEVKKNVNDHRNASLERAGITLEEVRSDEKFAQALRALGVEPPTKINTKGETKYAFAKKDLAFLALLEHEDEAVREIVQARFDNKTSQAVTRVEDFLGKSGRGLASVGIEYYGARTGRFGGYEGNYQNLNRNKLVSSDTPYGRLVFYKGKADRFIKCGEDGMVFLARHGWVKNEEDELHEVGLRDSIKAPKGKVLVVNDLSQIEARMLAYVAGEDWVVQAFANKQDIYKATASRSFGVPYEEITKSQRFVGKSQVLGLGYQAGVNGLKVVLGKRAEEFADSELQSWVNSYRASVPNIVGLWKSYKTALGAMVSGVNVQIDKRGILQQDGTNVIMPNGMKLVYRGMKAEKNERGYNQFLYWGRNVRTKKPDWEYTFEGRMVENCIAEGTEVLTDQGWVEIQNVTLEHKVYDGLEFVTHKGLLFKSVQACVIIDGVFMTDDHEVLTNDGWKKASVLLSTGETSSIQRLHKSKIWAIDVFTTNPTRASKWFASLALGVSMRMWEHNSQMWARLTKGSETWSYLKLWLCDKGKLSSAHGQAFDDRSPDVLDMAVNESEMHQPEPQGLAQLRGAWDHRMRAMANFVREFSGRYATELQNWLGIGSDRQQRGVLAYELPLGNSNSEQQQQTKVSSDQRGGRTINGRSILSAVQSQAFDSSLSFATWGNNASTSGKSQSNKKVYDLLDCGPRHRFVVRGESGPFIVHNCIQGLARIVLTTQMTEIKKAFRKRGWGREDAHLAMQVHDEVIVCCREDIAEEVLAIMQDCMSTPPDWASDLPLGSDGDIAKRYGCAK